jgi:hypothetical protein
MTYERETEFHGIKGMRFSVPTLTLANVTTNPDNLCYCIKPTNPPPADNETDLFVDQTYPSAFIDEDFYHTEGCVGAGVINLMSCQGIT